MSGGTVSKAHDHPTQSRTMNIGVLVPDRPKRGKSKVVDRINFPTTDGLLLHRARPLARPLEEGLGAAVWTDSRPDKNWMAAAQALVSPLFLRGNISLHSCPPIVEGEQPQ